MEVHKGTIYSIERDIFEKKLITASSDGFIRIFVNKKEPDDKIDLHLEHELDSMHGKLIKAIFLNHNEYLASAHSSGHVVIWKLDTNNTYAVKHEEQVFTGCINDISSNFNNEIINIYCACEDGKVRILNLKNDENIVVSEFTAHRFGISTIDSNNTFVVTGGLDYSTAVWENNKEIIRFRDHTSLVRDVCISPNNVFNILCFASCGEDCKVFIYWRHFEDFLKQEIILDEPVYSLSWSKSGFTLSIGYGQNKFKCYEPGNEGKYVEVELVSDN
ncbi:hypothetical protein NCER_100084 [Vairimorpha ceranae BRL01]|uniref:Uncharacterized protein n=1 Tax=Vairimorpha ceranae (strain BRL01) TaxID=578460 RepID=C4V6P3_VAIC1|nr:hypothetical protein NCER_100084 [Vairimorpha ceranae BRL01]